MQLLTTEPRTIDEPPRPPAMDPAERALHRLAWLVAASMAAASLVGLMVAGTYRDNALVSAGWRGNDLVTLVVGVPVLVASIRTSSRGSPFGRLSLLGMLLFAFYTYAFYLFGAAFNALFLVYVTIVGAAGYGLALALRSLDANRFEAARGAGLSTRAVAGYTVVVAVLLGGFWGWTSLAYLFTGAPPGMVEATAHPTNVTGALDLTIVVPLGILAGVRLWEGRPLGYVLAVAWNVKGTVYMLALCSAAVAAHRAGAAGDLAQVGLWAPIGLGCLLALGALRRAAPPATS